MSDFVHMRHPDIDALAGPVTRESFEVVHQHKGWEIVPEEEAVAAANEAFQKEGEAQAITADEIDAIKKRSDLDDLAILRDVDPTQHANMDSLRDAIKATL